MESYNMKFNWCDTTDTQMYSLLTRTVALDGPLDFQKI